MNNTSRKYKNAIVVTKPFQLFTALSVAEQEKILLTSEIYVIDRFYEAYDFVERFNKINYIWPNIIYLKDFKDTYKTIISKNYEKIFIDSDIGWKVFKLAIRKKLQNKLFEMNVFEEGDGVLRTDIRTGLKKIIFRIFGIGDVFGGCYFTKRIFLYNTNSYKIKHSRLSHKATSIVKTPASFFEENINFFEKFYAFNNYSKNINNFNRAILVLPEKFTPPEDIKKNDFIRDDSVNIFIKWHPHLKKIPRVDRIFQRLESNIPGEYAILWLAHVFQELVVYHYGSSSVSHIKRQNITILDARMYRN